MMRIEMDRNGGFHSHGGTPIIAGWFMREHPKQKMMI